MFKIFWYTVLLFLNFYFRTQHLLKNPLYLLWSVQARHNWPGHCEELRGSLLGNICGSNCDIHKSSNKKVNYIQYFCITILSVKQPVKKFNPHKTCTAVPLQRVFSNYSSVIFSCSPQSSLSAIASPCTTAQSFILNEKYFEIISGVTF